MATGLDIVYETTTGTVGDALVASRLQIVHGTTTGGDKPRPYGVPSRNRARNRDRQRPGIRVNTPRAAARRANSGS